MSYEPFHLKYLTHTLKDMTLEAEEPEHPYNSSPPGQNGRHFADDIFRCIFMNEKFYILFEISLKFLPNGLIDNNPALV